MSSGNKGYGDNWLTPESPVSGNLVIYQPVVRSAGGLLEKLPPELREILQECGRLAARYNQRLFLVGGIIRDLFLKRDNYDLDLVYTGDPGPYLAELSALIGGEWTVNSRFATGSIELSRDIKLDLARPRMERYSLSGALPEVKFTGPQGLAADIFRRDFTVNGILLEITPGSRGRLLDYFEGEKDLQKHLLRVFHRRSFQDDPTRIIRGIRLAVRRGLDFEKRTERLLREALEREYPALSSFRVLREFELLFQEEVTERLYKFIYSFPVYKLLNLTELPPVNYKKIQMLEDYLEYFQKKNYNIKEWLLRLAIVLTGIDQELLASWNLPTEERDILTSLQRNKGLLTALKQPLPPYTLAGYLRDLRIEELILLMTAAGDNQVERNITCYLEELAGIELMISGRDLLNEGFLPGPQLGNILEMVYAARLDGMIENREQELEYARKLKAGGEWSDT